MPPVSGSLCCTYCATRPPCRSCRLLAASVRQFAARAAFDPLHPPSVPDIHGTVPYLRQDRARYLCPERRAGRHWLACAPVTDTDRWPARCRRTAQHLWRGSPGPPAATTRGTRLCPAVARKPWRAASDDFYGSARTRSRSDCVKECRTADPGRCAVQFCTQGRARGGRRCCKRCHLVVPGRRGDPWHTNCTGTSSQHTAGRNRPRRCRHHGNRGIRDHICRACARIDSARLDRGIG